MARTVLTARKTTGGKIPRKKLANKAAVKKKSASAKENQPQPSTPPRPTKDTNNAKPAEESPSGDEAFKRPRRKEAPIDLISKKIRKIRSYEELIYIAERLFQKDPAVSKLITYFIYLTMYCHCVKIIERNLLSHFFVKFRESNGF